MNKPEVSIFTDGGCQPNPGKGGWGVYILFPDGTEEEYFGSENETTTNNRMEMTAFKVGISRALELLNNYSVTIYCDSQYVKEGITNWLPKWFRTNPRLNGVKNKDLWFELYNLFIECRGNVPVEWVKGHSTNIGNKRADELATRGVKANV